MIMIINSRETHIAITIILILIFHRKMIHLFIIMMVMKVIGTISIPVLKVMMPTMLILSVVTGLV